MWKEGLVWYMTVPLKWEISGLTVDISFRLWSFGPLLPKSLSSSLPLTPWVPSLSCLISTSQGTPKTVVSDQKLGKKHGMDSPPEPPEGTFIDTLILDFELPEI